MKMLAKPVLCACLAGLSLVGSADARVLSIGQDSNQEAANQRRQRGQNLPVREIERRVIPAFPGRNISDSITIPARTFTRSSSCAMDR
ncbi:hypothetical protein PIB19_13055 [Sphingomonas sp. 7/4-4]|uniref:hypothetical protein n=1 Tax=Sphingomonas sp. 7/4-4 TaxID=3018446 RepID=UPI0022F40272|nr:hypothetical protein [Sphingomonas sp. 7/4-4]WBY06517.1 hypothetical protein PIB19_13055 [Sphingomonas sp. 7/4-4]